MPTFEEIWKRIEAHAGEDFRQKRGQVFSYKVTGGSLTPSTTTWNIPRSQFEKAYALVPLEGPGDINHLHGPAYIYSILMDDRIRQGDWSRS